MKYLVKWTQTLYGEFEVEANSKEEAIDEVERWYDVCEIIGNELKAIEIE